MSDDHESPAGLLGIAIAAVGVCCALPLLLAAGIAVGAAGAALGSVVVVAAGSAAAVWGWRQRRRRAVTCDAGGRAKPADAVTSDASGGAADPADNRREDVRDGG